MELAALLQEFSRCKRAPVEVYFDGAPPGSAGSRKLGRITAHFVRIGSTADAAIRARLQAMKKEAKNWTVISSDHAVQSAARAAQAAVMDSESFAKMLKQAGQSAPKSDEERALSKGEVDQWLEIFKRGKAE